jgi:hypothetical protein
VAVIHFVERTDNVRKIDPSRNEWESGYWPLPEETAKKLVGSVLYLHRTKLASSHFGGEIIDYRIEQSEKEPAGPRVIFKLRAKADCKGVKIQAKGWSKDCKIVWDTPAEASDA